MEYTQFQSKVLELAKKKEACSSEYMRAAKCENITDLMSVIKDNFTFCCMSGIVSQEMADEFGVEIFNQNEIFINQNTDKGFLIAFGSATVEAYGSATVRAFDSASVWAFDSATVEASDSATVRASDSATVRASDSASVEAYHSATVRAYHSATVRASDSATVEAYHSATVRAYHSATVEAYHSATVEAYHSAYVNSFNTIEHKVSDNAILRYYYENRIVIANSETKIEVQK